MKKIYVHDFFSHQQVIEYFFLSFCIVSTNSICQEIYCVRYPRFFFFLNPADKRH